MGALIQKGTFGFYGNQWSIGFCWLFFCSLQISVWEHSAVQTRSFLFISGSVGDYWASVPAFPSYSGWVGSRNQYTRRNGYRLLDLGVFYHQGNYLHRPPLRPSESNGLHRVSHERFDCIHLLPLPIRFGVWPSLSPTTPPWRSSKWPSQPRSPTITWPSWRQRRHLAPSLSRQKSPMRKKTAPAHKCLQSPSSTSLSKAQLQGVMGWTSRVWREFPRRYSR